MPAPTASARPAGARPSRAATTARVTATSRRPELRNARDIGGLPAGDGFATRSGVLFRGDAPFAGDPPPGLDPWPPRTIVDLRSSGEGAADHPLAGDGIEIVSLPLLEAANPVRMAAEPAAGLPDLPAIYLNILATGAPSVARLVELVAESPGPVLIHCSAGKDRTGVGVAVILLAAGVPADAVIGDYTRTAANMEGVAQRLAENWQGPDSEAVLKLLTRDRPDLLDAPAFAIESALAQLTAYDGGVEGWLAANGVDSSVVDALRERLVVRSPDV